MKIATSIILIFLFSVSKCLALEIDTDITSRNVLEILEKDDRYPFIGFWKTNCSHQRGLIINKAGNGLYSVSFCGPKGSFKPGTYRPNTPLTGDPNYKIIDNDTIKVKTRSGFHTYHRCQAIK